MITLENVKREDLDKMSLEELEKLYDEHHDSVVTHIVDGAQVALTLLGAEIYAFYVIRLQERLKKVTELLGLYQTFHGLFSLKSEVESYDDNWGMPADCETLLSNNTLSETNIVDEKMIDLFHQIEQLEEKLGE